MVDGPHASWPVVQTDTRDAVGGIWQRSIDGVGVSDAARREITSTSHDADFFLKSQSCDQLVRQ